jgi:hypothetical protein
MNEQVSNKRWESSRLENRNAHDCTTRDFHAIVEHESETPPHRAKLKEVVS